jgi:hypothetical protein
LSAGTYTIEMVGVDSTGAPLVLSKSITVTARGTGSTGSTGSSGSSGGSSLPFTGGSALLLAGVGAAFVVTGMTLVQLRQRRSGASS